MGLALSLPQNGTEDFPWGLCAGYTSLAQALLESQTADSALKSQEDHWIESQRQMGLDLAPLHGTWGI